VQGREVIDSVQTLGIALLVYAPMLGVVALLACVVSLRARRGRDADVSEDDSGSDDGGGNLPRRDRPPDPTGGGDPAWWPEFERAFAEYVAACAAA
jgi:hypothetical protein